MSLCRECNNRSTCRTLCPEASVYISKDWVHLRELTVGLDPKQIKAIDSMLEEELSKVTEIFKQLPRERQVETLLARGLDRAKIAKVLEITRKNVRNIINRINKKRPKNTKVVGAI